MDSELPQLAKPQDDWLTRYLADETKQYLAADKSRFWARMDYWALWEALLLINGFNPEYFRRHHEHRMSDPETRRRHFEAPTKSSVEEAMADYSPNPWAKGAEQYWEMYQTLKRSPLFKERRVNPREFTAWACETAFAVHEPIATALQSLSGPLPIWGYERTERYDPDGAYLGPNLDGPKWISAGVEKSDDGKQPEAALPSVTSALQPIEENLHPKAKDSLLKLVATMAVQGYRYDPRASRNEAIAEIETDSQLLGLSLTDDTIRKWVAEGCALIDQGAVDLAALNRRE